MVNRIIRMPSVGQTGCWFVFFLPGQATQSRPCGLSPLFVSSFFLCLQPPCFLFRHRLLASSLSPSPHHLTQHFHKQAIFYGCATSSVNNLDYITTLKCLETTWCLPQQPFKTHSSSPSSLPPLPSTAQTTAKAELAAHRKFNQKNPVVHSKQATFFLFCFKRRIFYFQTVISWH